MINMKLVLVSDAHGISHIVPLRASPARSLYELPASQFAGSPANWSEEEVGGGSSPVPGKSPRHPTSFL